MNAEKQKQDNMMINWDLSWNLSWIIQANLYFIAHLVLLMLTKILKSFSLFEIYLK